MDFFAKKAKIHALTAYIQYNCGSVDRYLIVFCRIQNINSYPGTSLKGKFESMLSLFHHKTVLLHPLILLASLVFFLTFFCLFLPPLPPFCFRLLCTSRVPFFGVPQTSRAPGISPGCPTLAAALLPCPLATRLVKECHR